ncbi:hypothetical protein FB451DRAFT_1513358 [Mycena latifolia]|nr:hypothetical protein FB451DRAFT_1513358 [Mycena latifolia]
MDDNTSHAQLIVTTLLGISALIPGAPLRYTVLGITIFLALIHVIYLKHPSTQLRQLREIIGTIEATIRSAKLLCPRDQITLTEEGVLFLEVQRVVSKVLCRVLETDKMTWSKYRVFARDIAECTNQVKAIRTTVRLIVEAERQRKLTEEISEAQLILGTGMSLHFKWDISLTHSPVRHRGARNPQDTLLPYAPACR